MTESLVILLTKSKFYAMIKVDEKPCINNMTFVSSKSFTGAFYRMVHNESADNLLLHVNLYVNTVGSMLEDHKHSSFYPTVISHGTEALAGLSNLLITYKSRPAVVTKLTVLIQQLQNILDIAKQNLPNNGISYNKSPQTKPTLPEIAI